MSDTVLDEIDDKIFEKRELMFLARTDIKSGDYIRFEDGEERRVTHVWSDGCIQTTIRGNVDTSFYLGDGFMEFSGSLDPGIRIERLTRSTVLKAGYCWIFHHDHADAGRGKHGHINCPVWDCKGNSKLEK